MASSGSDEEAVHEIVGADARTYLDLYKLAMDMADRVSARRGVANGFFLTLNAGLIAVIGFVHATSQPTISGQIGSLAPTGSRTDTFGPIYVSVGGLVLTAVWWLMLKSYRDLNRAKFAVIGEMEQKLPVEPMNAEWKYLKGDPIKNWRSRYAELGTIERIVPLVFAAIYLAAIIRFAT